MRHFPHTLVPLVASDNSGFSLSRSEPGKVLDETASSLIAFWEWANGRAGSNRKCIACDAVDKFVIPKLGAISISSKSSVRRLFRLRDGAELVTDNKISSGSASHANKKRSC